MCREGGGGGGKDEIKRQTRVPSEYNIFYTLLSLICLCAPSLFSPAPSSDERAQEQPKQLQFAWAQHWVQCEPAPANGGAMQRLYPPTSWPKADQWGKWEQCMSLYIYLLPIALLFLTLYLLFLQSILLSFLHPLLCLTRLLHPRIHSNSRRLSPSHTQIYLPTTPSMLMMGEGSAHSPRPLRGNSYRSRSGCEKTRHQWEMLWEQGKKHHCFRHKNSVISL